ncbi:hypothetical protein DL96DRAFT_1469107 [Flagelloscypha sp. PMI_526]|nr:hypothetical protein DL96DRAFT_1469107 [Flagelloscypha sp. PMI_526]
MNNKEAVNDLNEINDQLFEQATEGRLICHRRLFTLLIEYVSLSFDFTENEMKKRIDELAETNNFDAADISSLDWARKRDRRSGGQRVAHLLLKTTNKALANKLILNGILIAHSRNPVRKSTRIPLQCNKCQGPGHMVRNCQATKPTCGNCSNDHDTKECRAYHRFCANCKTRGHGANDCMCPLAVKRQEDYDANVLENIMPFFYDATDASTWVREIPEGRKRDWRSEVCYNDDLRLTQNRQGRRQQDLRNMFIAGRDRFQQATPPPTQNPRDRFDRGWGNFDNDYNERYPLFGNY